MKPFHYLTQIGGIPETQEMLDYSVANKANPFRGSGDFL
jgi:hypothetical protein